MAQPDLFTKKETGRRTLQEKFDIWIKTPKGELVYKQSCGLARKLKGQGYTSYGMAAIFEYMRFEHSLANGPKDDGGYKLSNSFRAFLSRYIMLREEDLYGFFTTKAQTNSSVTL